MALVDAFGSEVIMTNSFIRYRDRIIDYGAVSVFQVKQRKLLINNFKQNTTLPTMCIYFKTKEEALEALDILMDSYYSNETEETEVQKHKSWSDLISSYLGF